MFKVFITVLLTSYLQAEFMVVANMKFPLNALSKEQVRNIFLKKVNYIDAMKIYPINISTKNSLRNMFQNSVIGLSKKRRRQYWIKAHYKGISNPKVLLSQKSIIEYLKQIDGAISYISSNMQTEELKVLYRQAQ